MGITPEPIFSAALALPPEQRAALAEKLWESLQTPRQKEIDAAWVEEAERRLQAYKEGKLRAIPASEVFASLLRR